MTCYNWKSSWKSSDPAFARVHQRPLVPRWDSQKLGVLVKWSEEMAESIGKVLPCSAVLTLYLPRPRLFNKEPPLTSNATNIPLECPHEKTDLIHLPHDTGKKLKLKQMLTTLYSPSKLFFTVSV
jgi:hypothetical protein